MSDPKHSDDEAVLADLAVRYFDGVADAEEVAWLEQMLEGNPERREQFVWLSYQSALLAHHGQSAPAAKDPPTIVVKEGTRAAEAPRWSAALGAAVALAACVLVAVGVWQFWSGKPVRPIAGGESKPPVVQFAGHWRITPTGDADFQVDDPMLVRLDRGELLVESTKKKSLATDGDPKAPLQINTPIGKVFAKGTRFYVGSHKPIERGERAMFAPLTRVLVLSGVVTLSTAIGTIEGTAGDLLAAEADKPPTRLAVQANSNFAFDLYQQLASENEGKNLFFSPYSVSGALAMAAEGARQETAAEMGKVLRFPDAMKRISDDAQRIPWKTSLIHTGMSELNRKLNGADDDPAKTTEVRAKIAELRNELDAVKANMVQMRADKKWDEWRVERKKEQDVVAKLNAELSKVDQYELRVANGLWGEKTYPFDPNYTKTISTHYDTGGVFPVDFRTNFEAERLKINGWVEDQTNDRIKDLLPKGSLNDLTRLVLTNAIYFKGDWSVPFKEKNTKNSDFTLSGGDKQQTPIMHAPNLGVGRYGAFNADGSHFNTPMRIGRDQDPKGHYPKADGFAIVELPYKGDDLSMIVIVPNVPAGLSAIENKLTPENLKGWIGQLKKRNTHVYLPKFKMERGYKLGDTLEKMGMVRAFKDPRDPKTGAQFKGMTTSTDPMKQLYITGVFHKAFVEVNEKGTEAAAATGVGLTALSEALPRDVPFTPEFKADRPFVYLIREKSTGSVLFLGRMTQPNN